MEPISDHHRRAITCLYIIAGVILALSMVGSGVALLDRFQQSDQRREQQTTINKLIATQALENCQEIENLKDAQREQAQRSFHDLDKNLKLLHLKKTPEIVQTAVENRDRILNKYAAQPCPRPIKEVARK